jgi:putative heme-binding domain-containing protein
LLELASDPSKPLHGRVAALFALKQIEGIGSHASLRQLAQDDALREFALRALADRKSQLEGVEPAVFVAALADPSPRVRAQALIALARLGAPSVADRIVPLTMRPDGSSMPTERPISSRPDPDRAIPHLAIRTLVQLRAIDACLNAIEGPYREGALRALRSLHDPRTVEGLITKLTHSRGEEVRRELLATLARLYRREADYDGSWWGIRPDTTGPYYDPRPWESSDRIALVLESAIRSGDEESDAFLMKELARYRIRLKGLASQPEGSRKGQAEDIPVVIVKVDPTNPDQAGNMSYEAASRRVRLAKGNAQRGSELFVRLSCVSCHTTADGQSLKGPHLVDIGKRYSADELLESILRPGAKMTQGYETYNFAMADGRVFSGFIVSEGAKLVQIREASGATHELDKTEVEERQRQDTSAMPDGIAASLTPEELADFVSYLQSLTP